jgi:hypothetical protein
MYINDSQSLTGRRDLPARLLARVAAAYARIHLLIILRQAGAGDGTMVTDLRADGADLLDLGRFPAQVPGGCLADVGAILHHALVIVRGMVAPHIQAVVHAAQALLHAALAAADALADADR